MSPIAFEFKFSMGSKCWANNGASYEHLGDYTHVHMYRSFVELTVFKITIQKVPPKVYTRHMRFNAFTLNNDYFNLYFKQIQFCFASFGLKIYERVTWQINITFF